MSKQLKFSGVFNLGDCKYGGKFTLDGTDIGYRFEVSLIPVCRRTHFLFIPTGCAVKKLDVLPKDEGYVDTYPPPLFNENFIFKVKIVDPDGEEDPDDDDCRIYTFEWKAWRYSSADQVKPLSVDLDGDFNVGGGLVVKGKGKVHIESEPNASGRFRIRVCCKKKELEGETSCQPNCTLLNP
jgi:hypothetical protein